jgi:molecular chaperone GrpE
LAKVWWGIKRKKEGAMQQNGQEGEPNTASDTDEIEQRLTKEQKKAEECMSLLQRTQADFVNYRRRMSQEQGEARIAAQSALLSHFLPVLDDLGRALGAAPPELSTHPWVQGLVLIVRRIGMLLDQLGVQQIGVPGERFDPRWHEAITTEARTDMPEGTIVHVIQPGYVLGERVIRPAQVIVAHAPTPVIEVHDQHGNGSTH